jgi:hypothetical protein
MELIIATIKAGNTGLPVTNLQDALLALLNHQIIRHLDPPNHPTLEELRKLIEVVKAERSASRFGEATTQLLKYFQIQEHLGDKVLGVVEDKTADRLNEHLRAFEKGDRGKDDHGNDDHGNDDHGNDDHGNDDHGNDDHGNDDHGPSKRLVVGTVSYPDDSHADGLSVVAFDKDVGDENRLGDAITDSKGRYRIEYGDAEAGRKRDESRGRDVFVRVHDENAELLFQSQMVRNAPVELVLDVQLPHKPLVVRGQVRFADGMPVPGVVVAACDKDLRVNQQLGKPTTSGSDGRYEIRYSAGQFARAEKRSADLQVSAHREGEEPVSSEILFNAPADALVDLVLPRGEQDPSEFEILLTTLLPLLEGQGTERGNLPIEDLEPRDVDFLAGDTGSERQRIDWLVQGFKLARESDLPAAAFYGWFRLGMPGEPTRLWGTPTDKLLATLRVALKQHIIPAGISGQLDAIGGRIEQIKHERALGATAAGTGTTMGDLLATLAAG